MAFHPYPQVIPPVCNPDGFGPPRACSARFTLPKGRSPSFGSVARHLPPFRTRVRSGSGCPCLNLATNNHSSAHSTKGTPSQPSAHADAAPTGWKRTVSGSLSLPSPGCFSPFPHGTVRYRSLRVSSLGKWAPQLHTGLLVSGATQGPVLRQHTCLLPGCHGLWRRFPDVFG